MFCVFSVFTEALWRKMKQFHSNETTSHFQHLPISNLKVDQSELRIHEVPPLH